MSRPPLPSSLIKPSMETRFYIDFDWWRETGQDLRTMLVQLCEEYGGPDAASISPDAMVDWVDPQTAEVRRVDGLMYVVLSRCSQHEEFITERTALVEAIFRALLASGNRPLTPLELAQRVGRPPEVILRTLSGRQVYKGIRPYLEED